MIIMATTRPSPITARPADAERSGLLLLHHSALTSLTIKCIDTGSAPVRTVAVNATTEYVPTTAEPVQDAGSHGTTAVDTGSAPARNAAVYTPTEYVPPTVEPALDAGSHGT